MKKIYFLMVLIVPAVFACAQITGGGSESKPTKTEKAKKTREGNLGFYFHLGYRMPMGSLGKTLDQDGWGGTFGIGTDIGQQFTLNKISDMFPYEEIKVGLDFSYLNSSLVLLKYNSGIISTDGSGIMSTVGVKAGAFVSYNIPNTDLYFDCIYKLGLSYFYFQHYMTVNRFNSEEYVYYSTDDPLAFGLRKNLSVNIRYNIFLINTGFEWGRSKQDIFLSPDFGDGITYTDEYVPSGMFCFSVGMMF